jgi:hypothetical protein
VHGGDEKPEKNRRGRWLRRCSHRHSDQLQCPCHPPLPAPPRCLLFCACRMYQFLSYYQRELALWLGHNLDTCAADICLDTELAPAFKVCTRLPRVLPIAEEGGTRDVHSRANGKLSEGGGRTRPTLHMCKTQDVCMCALPSSETTPSAAADARADGVNSCKTSVQCASARF